jgi:RNA polymerase sigma-70 factor, ECF subfamily
MSDTHKITELLQAWSAGDSKALDELIPLVDRELKQIARAYMRKEKQGHTLQTTALVVEAFIRLMQGEPVDWQNRHQFYAIVARRMRQVLTDHARQKLASRRGLGAEHVNIDDVFLTSEQSEELLLLHEALEKLAQWDERKALIVEYRYFGGFTFKDVAAMLGVSLSTVDREWGLARVWLKKEITPDTLD